MDKRFIFYILVGFTAEYSPVFVECQRKLESLSFWIERGNLSICVLLNNFISVLRFINRSCSSRYAPSSRRWFHYLSICTTLLSSNRSTALTRRSLFFIYIYKTRVVFITVFDFGSFGHLFCRVTVLSSADCWYFRLFHFSSKISWRNWLWVWWSPHLLWLVSFGLWQSAESFSSFTCGSSSALWFLLVFSF